MESNATMPMLASSSAAVVVTMTTIVSFCFIGMSRKVRTWLYFSTDLATFNSLELSLSPAFSAAV